MSKKQSPEFDTEPKKERPPLTERGKQRLALKRFVRIFYDLQRIRIQVGGRGRATKIDLRESDLARLESYEKHLEKLEKEALGDVREQLKNWNFYRDVLSDKSLFKGVGPTMAGVILSEFDIERADTPSDFWAFAGLGVKDGKAQRLERGVKSTFNTWLRTKMVGVLADVLIKVGSSWTKFYYDYKQRKISAGWGKNDGHRHNASKRYMIKMLLLDLWRRWREYEKLPVRPSYQEQYLGHVHTEHQAAPPVDADSITELAVEVDEELKQAAL